MHNMDPITFLRMQEQDRERDAARRALERAARAGGEQRSGLVRAGISGFARVLHVIASSAGGLRLGRTSTSTNPTGSSGA
jgi:hypothetical protein